MYQMLRAKPFDLAIVGGGPAGTSAAITAARLGARVVLLEARDFPRHKVCGEFVSAESLDVLAILQRDLPQTAHIFRAAPVIQRARFYHGNREMEVGIAPAAISVSRYELDAALWDAAAVAGVDVRANCQIATVAGDGPFELKTPTGDVSAQALVVAAGRWSAFTADRTVPPGPKWIGVKGHFRERNPNFSSDLYFFEHGYCGVQPVAADVVNACAMVRSDRAMSLPDVLKLHPLLAKRSAAWTAVTQPVSTAPLIYRKPEPVRGNVMFAGDAAAFIDPFVGDGISIAVRSGRVAAECISKFLSGAVELTQAVESYRQEYARQFSPLLSAASRLRPLLSLPPMARYAVFELLRFPGLIPMFMRRTRQAS